MLFSKTLLAAVALVAMTATNVDAHVGLKFPCPRDATFKGCPAIGKGHKPDYDINSPVGTYSKINSPICKNPGTQTKRAVYKAGQTIKTNYSIGAPHGGGHCQWSLSYDGGKHWIVIKTIIRDCFATAKYNKDYFVPVQIPKNAPSSKKVIFQWQWNNAIGNRELYSNCVDIEIKGTNGGTLKGVQPLIANYGKGSFPIPEFPNKKDDDKHAQFAKRKAITIKVPKA